MPRALLGAFGVLLALSGAPACAAAQAGRAANSSGRMRPSDRARVRAALATAERYWGAAPCGGKVAVRWRSDAPASPLRGTVVEAWASFDTPLGPDDFAAAPVTFTACTVNLSRARWPQGAIAAGAYPALCQVMVHELGHLMGWPDSLAYPRSDIRYPVLGAANMPAVCAREARSGAPICRSFETGESHRCARGRRVGLALPGRAPRRSRVGARCWRDIAILAKGGWQGVRRLPSCDAPRARTRTRGASPADQPHPRSPGARR
jgi:hypothetical protein